MAGPVTVRVPATSANLGPGFDALGLALDLHDELEAEVVDDGLHVDVDGQGAGVVPLDEAHLVVRSMRAACDALGVAPPGLRLRCRNVVPHARGLGSSSAAIVGGIVLAAALVVDGDRLGDPARLRLADAIEGHPDNVAAALLGGLTIAWTGDSGARAHRLDVTGVRAVALVPPTAVETSRARGLLPATVAHADAARNAGRSALLVPALTGRPDLLMAATEDRLHQEQRAPAMPETLAVVAALREREVPAVVSGAGPTVLALVATDEQASAAVAAAPSGWDVHRLAVDPSGARVVGAEGR